MAILDFHAHVFSRPFFEALAAQSPLPGDPAAKLAAVCARAKIDPPSPDLGAHLARWVADLDRHGIERMAAFASAPEEIPAVAELASMSKGRLVPFAVVNPKVEGVAGKVATLMGQKGFRGVLLFPAMHHFHIAGAEAEPLLRALDERNGVAYVHCGVLIVKLRDLFGLPRAIDLAFANPLGLIPAAQRFPRVHLVIPHFGAGFLREALIAGAQCPNVYVDTSSSNSWMATQAAPTTLKDVFARTLGVFGPQRILFGTDSNTFPTGWRRDRLDEQRTALAAAGASSADQELIFAGNARRLLAP